MRCHLPTISAKRQEHHHENHIDDTDTSYGLRENPKKTWRTSDSKNQCRECGKEFLSMRALSGHMKFHSIKEKDNVCEQCGKGFGSMRALFGHMRHHSKRPPEKQSEYENLCPVRRKRSKLRYKVSANLSLTNSNASSSSSYVSEIEELEEAALSLIMLSRGVTNLSEFNSLLESSENNNSEIWKKEKKLRGRLGSCVSGSWNSLCEKNESEFEFGELGSGFLVENEKKADLGFSIDEFKKSELDDDLGIELFDAEIENGNDPSEFGLMREVGLLDEDDSEVMKSNSSKEATFDDQEDLEFGGNFSDQMTKTVASFSGIFEDSEKKPEYECRTCKRIFRSYRALGGHRSGHKINGCGVVVKIGSHESGIESTQVLNNFSSNFDPEKLECNENVVEEIGFFELKKGKDHECPICFKVFPSGQALGGHKRAHYIGFSANTTTKESVLAKEEEVSELQIVCDLNLPVLCLENEVDVDHVGFKQWWAESGHEREPLLISN